MDSKKSTPARTFAVQQYTLRQPKSASGHGGLHTSVGVISPLNRFTTQPTTTLEQTVHMIYHKLIAATTILQFVRTLCPFNVLFVLTNTIFKWKLSSY